MYKPKVYAVIGFILMTAVFCLLFAWASKPPVPRPFVAALPAVPTAPDPTNKQYVAALDVARVFGRSQGCAEADPKLINAVATEAAKADLDPRVLAATVAVESSCNPWAVSSRGAIGLTQVEAAIWKDKFDFAGSVNLLNPADNLRAGATIEGSLIKQFGLVPGVRRYNGLGVDCQTCDSQYVSKILTLAGRH